MDEIKPTPPRITEVENGHLWPTGGMVEKHSVALRFFGDEIIPDEISAMLQCQPTKAFQKGDVIPDKKYQRIASTGSWILKGSLMEEEQIEKQILAILSKASDELDVWSYLTAKFYADIFLGIFMKSWNQGLVFSPETMLQLSRRHLNLGFDIYCDEGSNY